MLGLVYDVTAKCSEPRRNPCVHPTGSSSAILPLFCDISDTNFDRLTSAAYLQHLPPHMTLITEGDLPDFLQAP